jgi:hypothetical protein
MHELQVRLIFSDTKNCSSSSFDSQVNIPSLAATYFWLMKQASQGTAYWISVACTF